MRIANIVHNQVYSDARVRKVSYSLAKNGYKVTIFGYGSSKKIEDIIESCKLIIIPKLNLGTINLNSNKYKYKIFLEKIKILAKLIKILVKPIKYIRKSLNLFIRKSGGIVIGYNKVANKIFKAIDVNEFDVIHAHDIIGLIVAIRLKNRKNTLKIIWDAHEVYTELQYKYFIDKFYINFILKRFSKRIDAFITINNSFVKYYKKRYPFLPNASIVMNATRKCNLDKKDFKSPLREFSNIDACQKILLFQGGLQPNRGIDILLDLADNNLPKDWTILFMGKGDLENEIKEKMKIVNKDRKVGMEAIKIIPPAPYEDLSKWTNGATLGTIFYKGCNYNQKFCTPNKLWEYPNAEIPILATELFEISKLVKKYGIGILVPENTTSTKIGKLLNDLKQEKIDDMVENCRTFNNNENWYKYEKELLNVYNSFNKTLNHSNKF